MATPTMSHCYPPLPVPLLATRLTTALSIAASPGRHNIHQIPPLPPPFTLNHQVKMFTVKQQLVSRVTPVFKQTVVTWRRSVQGNAPLETHHVPWISLVVCHDIWGHVQHSATFWQESLMWAVCVLLCQKEKWNGYNITTYETVHSDISYVLFSAEIATCAQWFSPHFFHIFMFKT